MLTCDFLDFADEIKREREFYRARGLPCPKDVLPNAGEVEDEKASADAHAEADYHRADEQVKYNFQTSFLSRNLLSLCKFIKRPFLWRIKFSTEKVP